MTASDARPPSDTEATGWHRHDGGNVFRDDYCEFHGGPHIPVLVLDPAEARETIARTLHSVDKELDHVAWDDLWPGYESEYLDAADAVLAALAGQEQP